MIDFIKTFIFNENPYVSAVDTVTVAYFLGSLLVIIFRKRFINFCQRIRTMDSAFPFWENLIEMHNAKYKKWSNKSM